MFLIKKEENEAVSLEKQTFKNLGFKERKHLQEWICKNPNILGENLLIIQKEFCGFDDTNERLDLLALDESGRLVIIENKLDDSGRDVVWQSLKYVSYCAGLSKSDIRDVFQRYLDMHNISDNAEQIISEFLGISDFEEVELNKDDQRIVLVAAKFRKEVTSTVMWLLEHNVKIKCIIVTPYVHGDNIFIDTEQIIPIKEAEEYQISLVNKKQGELILREKNQTRHIVRKKFWNNLIEAMNQKSSLFSNVNPSKDNWLGCGSGFSGISYVFVITSTYCRVELWINRGSKEENKVIFDSIILKKSEIETSFGNKLDWQRKDDGKGSRVAYSLQDVNVFIEDDWNRMISFMVENMIKLEHAIKEVLMNVIIK